MSGKGGRLASWRTRLPVVAVVVACVTAVVAAVTGAANPVSAVQFLMPGHWVYNSALQSVLHVDGSTGNVDARARVPGGPGDQVFQGDRSGYVVGSSRITEFGKSSLEVEETTTPASKEPAYGVETRGGPYLVYRESGTVVRMGDPSVTMKLDGPVGTPVATPDGTLWLPRTEAGLLCQVRAGARTPACQVPLPKGRHGALTVVHDEVVFVDTTSDTLHTVQEDGLGAGRDLGMDASDDAVLADTDMDGKVVILDANRIHLVDPESDREPDGVDLPEGDYAGPVSTGQVVAVVDRKTDTLFTYDGEGDLEHKELPAESGDPRITRGEDDRLYVDGEEGEHVVVVDRDGEFTDVPIDGGNDEEAAPPRGDDTEGPPVAGPEPTQTAPPRPPRSERQPPSTERSDPRREQQQQAPPRVPPTQPGAPAGVSASPGNATATVSWGPAADNRSPLTGYRVTWAGGSRTTGPGQRSVTIPGLANGTSYVFTVAAVNGVGTGPGSSSNPVTPVAPFRAATAPVGLTAVNDFDNRTVTVNWGAPADMGSGVFAHYVVNVGGFRQVTVTGLSASVPGVQVDTAFTVTVTAVTTNPAGAQVAGAAASAQTEGRPPGGNPVVTLREGEPTDEYCSESPDCALMHVEASGFPPNTMIRFTAYSTQDSEWSNSHETPTDENGFADIDEFAYGGTGYEVWVVVTTPDGNEYTSNRITWGEG